MIRIAPVLLVTAAIGAGQTPPVSQAEMERFLKTAKIVEIKVLVPAAPSSKRALLDDGKMKHHAAIQTVNVTRAEFEGPPKKRVHIPALGEHPQINVRDWYLYNIAAYELNKILGLDMVPPTVEREVDGVQAAITWWVDDVLMDEAERARDRIQPPDPNAWSKQMYVVRLFDQLIYNTDRNPGNLLISKQWKLWMIDHTRAFRVEKTLLRPENLVRCDRKLVQRLRALNDRELTQKLKLNPMEIEALLARRDAIVEHFDRQIAQKGEQAVLYDDD